MEWLRLWHDMPNDPKWRTISRLSGEPVALVISTYIHLLVDASRNVTRGHVTVTTEDLSSALDVTEAQISAVLKAMQGRVLDDGVLLGWDKRQPKREDSGNPETGAKSAAERQREHRERKKREAQEAASNDVVTQCHDASRNVTLDKIREDEIREEESKRDPRETVLAGSICWAMKKQGVADVNPSNPTLLALMDAGATIDEFRAAASKAIAKGKGFSYALAIVRTERESAKGIADNIHQGPMPKRQASEPAWRTEERERIRQAAPGIAAKSTQSATIIDMEASNVTAIGLG